MFESIWNLSDTLSEWSWISNAPKPDAIDVPTFPKSQAVKAGRSFSGDAENLMRLFKFMEPACMGLTLWGWKGGVEALVLIEGSRKLITTVVRPIKAVDAVRNSKRGSREDSISWVLRTYVAPISYGSLALVGGAALLAKRGVIPPFTGWNKWCITKYLTHVGAAGSVLGGMGGFYAWYRTAQKMKYDNAADNQALKDLRFWSFCNGLRYTMEGVVGIAAINYGPFQGWAKVWTKAVPASIGLYQSVVRSWMQAA